MLTTDRWLAFLPHAEGPAGTAPPALPTGYAELACGRARVWTLLAGGADPRAEGGPLRLIDTVPGSHARVAGWPKSMHFEDLQDALQVFTEIRENGPGGLRISGDLLAVRPVYLRRRPEGWWLSNRIDLLRLAVPPEPLASKLPLLEYFIMLSPMGRRTLEGGAERLQAGDWVAWSEESGPALHAEGLRVWIGRRDPDEHPRVAADTLKQVIFDSIDRKLKWHSRLPVLALSGGFDSRLIGAAFRSMGHRPAAYTYGEPHHQENWAARQIARRLGLKLCKVPYPRDMLRSRMPMHFEILQGQIDPHVLHIANLLAIPEADGTAIMHGFLGDAITGSFVTSLRDDAFTSKDALADAIARRYAYPTLLRAAEAAGISHPLDLLRQAVYDDLQPAPTLYQSAMLWTCMSRQRRFTASQAEILGPRFAPFYPFYDRAFMELWLNQSMFAQIGRTLLRTLFILHFPTVATVPHPSANYAITPTLKNILHKFARDRAMDLRERAYKLVGREAPHPDIMRISYGGETEEIRRAMAQEAAEAAPALKMRFGIDVPPDLLAFCFPDGQLYYDGLHTLRRFWALARYARWAEEGEAAAGMAPVRRASAA